MSSNTRQLIGKLVFLVHFKLGIMKSLKMQTRKRVLQEWKNFPKFVWFLDTVKHPESKSNLLKGLTCVNSVYFTSLCMLFRSKKKFVFSFPKNWISFFPHARVLLFGFKNGPWVKRGAWKSSYCRKRKEKAQINGPTSQKLSKLHLWFKTRKWEVGILCL